MRTEKLLKQEYRAHVRRCKAIEEKPAPFDRFKQEWLDVRRVEKTEVRLSYKQIYRERREYNWTLNFANEAPTNIKQFEQEREDVF